MQDRPTVPKLPPEVAERVAALTEHIRAGRFEQASYTVRKLPTAFLSHPAVLLVRGAFECKCGRFDAGLAMMQRACHADPGDQDLVAGYGEMLWAAGRRDQCLALLEAHHKAHPNDLKPIKLLSDYYYRMGLTPVAFAYSRKMAALVPHDVDTMFFLGYRHTDLRQYPTGIEWFEKAAALAPTDGRAIQGLVFAMLYHGTDPVRIRAVTEAWARAAGAGVPRARPRIRPRQGRLRIAYLSGDLRAHVVCAFFEDILRQHDRSRVHVTCYSNCEVEDHVSARLQAAADRWRHIHSLSDENLCQVIQADDIDVLIDLGGHTDSSRLSVLERRPAPVQATYLGYPATTGMPEVDYRITDAIADPPGMTDDHYTERLFRLPRCAWAYRQMEESDHDPSEPGPVFRPELAGMFTFGSFNLLTKVNQASVALWSKVLAASAGASAAGATAGGARLLMTDRRNLLGDSEAVELLRGEFASGGADLSRVLLASWVPDARLQRRRLREVDCMLDPLSYNGTTTTCEALWHGVPVLTLPGRAHVSRVGASLLTALGLEPFIARDEADFIDKARALVYDPAPLRELRASLRERFAASPLGDHAGMARALEDAFLTMHDQEYRRRG